MMMETSQALPIWILLSFSVLLIGIITLIYTRGNWRTTLLLMGLAIMTILVIFGIDHFHGYLKTHFIGRFDHLGIPFREAGPGWVILAAAWPLWLAPTLFVTVVAVAADYLLRNHTKLSSSPAVTTSTLPAREPVPLITPTFVPKHNLAHTLEVESLKQELTSTKEKLDSVLLTLDETMDKREDLEIEIEQLQEDQQENTLELEEKITALELELSAKETENEELTTLALQQAEEIATLKDQLEQSSFTASAKH